MNQYLIWEKLFLDLESKVIIKNDLNNLVQKVDLNINVNFSSNNEILEKNEEIKKRRGK